MRPSQSSKLSRRFAATFDGDVITKVVERYPEREL
jgi:hypothetical protein